MRDANYKCDLHARQQTLAVLDVTTGDVAEKTPANDGNNVEGILFDAARTVRVGIDRPERCSGFCDEWKN
jgi:hypothetical protein